MNVKKISIQLTFHFNIYWRHSIFFFRKPEEKIIVLKISLVILFFNGFFFCVKDDFSSHKNCYFPLVFLYVALTGNKSTPHF